MSDRGRPPLRPAAVPARPRTAAHRTLVGLLVVSMLLPLAGPVLLGRTIDDALAGRPTTALTALAIAYLGVAVGGEVLRLGVTWSSINPAWRVGTASGRSCRITP